MTVEDLRTVLDYDPTLGMFKWRVDRGTRGRAGSVAGTVYRNGRRYITIGRKRYFAAHLAWAFVHGAWPDGQIDHRNLVRSDDRIENLRIATRPQNSANRRVLPNNRLGIKGVGASTLRVRSPQRYRARIRVNGRLLHLGYFSSPEDANRAYADAAAEHFGEFARSA